MTTIPKLKGAPDFGKRIAPDESVGKRLEGKRILLTGTTKGVGHVAQELLCAHGAFVCGSGRTPGAAAAYADELKAKGYKRRLRLRFERLRGREEVGCPVRRTYGRH